MTKLKKLASLILMLALTLNIVGQKKIFFDKDWKKTKEKNAKYYRIVTPNGSLFQVEDFFKETDKQQMTGSYSGKKLLDTERTGTFTYYYKSGKKSSEGEYLRGKQTGKWKNFFKNGELKSEGEYILGEADGLWVYLHKNGKPKSKINYIDGSKNGNIVLYFDNGDVDEEYNFIKGKKDGAFKEYYKGNVLKESGTYEKDSLNGIYEYFWENKNMSCKGEFKDNKKEGTWTWYHSNGRNSCIAEYKKNLFLKADYYDEKGEKQSKKIYEDDLVASAEFAGTFDDLLKAINKNIGKKVDFDQAKKEKISYLIYVTLLIDEEGNIKERNFTLPDVEDEDFEDEWGLIRNFNTTLDVLPRFTPKKAYNRNVRSNYTIIYSIDFEKGGTTSLRVFR